MRDCRWMIHVAETVEVGQMERLLRMLRVLRMLRMSVQSRRMRGYRSSGSRVAQSVTDEQGSWSQNTKR